MDKSLIIEKPGAGDKTQGTGTSIFSKDGAVGKMFNGGPDFSSFPSGPGPCTVTVYADCT